MLIPNKEVLLMRITVTMKEKLVDEVKRLAANEKRSVSSLISEAVEYYIREKKKREAGEELLRLSGNVHVDEDALLELERGRTENDRT